MNKEEFLRQLENLLSGISEEERADAMAYYRSYFEDAGPENEAAILEELESPQKVAQSILKDLGADWTGESAFRKGSNNNYNNYNKNDRMRDFGEENNRKNKNAGIAIGVCAAVILSPIWLTLLLVVICVIFSLIVALIGVAIAVVATMAALVFVGFLILGVGIGMLFGGNPAVGIGLAGAGLIVLALGLLAVILVVWTFGWFLPWAWKGLVRLCKMPFEHGKEKKAL